MLFIAYFFEEKEGVGALRSRTLKEFLEKNDIKIDVVDKNSFSRIINNYIILWTIATCFRVICSKEKKIYISCGPFLHLFFVSITSFFFRKELIIDFRDPWSINLKSGYNGQVKPNLIKIKIAESIEKLSYKICKKFIVCTKGMYVEYEALFEDNKKLVEMTNGYNFDSVAFKMDERNLEIYKIVTLGKFAEYDKNKARKALYKVKELATQRPIELVFIGSNREVNSEILAEFDLLKDTEFHERMAYEKALNLASTCNLAMIILRDENIEYGTKIFDYIGLNLNVIDIFEKESFFRMEFEIFFKGFSQGKVSETIKNSYHRESIYSKNINIFL